MYYLRNMFEISQSIFTRTGRNALVNQGDDETLEDFNDTLVVKSGHSGA